MGRKITPADVREGDESPPVEDRHTKVVAELYSYRVYRNRKEKTVTFYATDYHAGVLILTEAGLEKLLLELKGK